MEYVDWNSHRLPITNGAAPKGGGLELNSTTPIDRRRLLRQPNAASSCYGIPHFASPLRRIASANFVNFIRIEPSGSERFGLYIRKFMRLV